MKCKVVIEIEFDDAMDAFDCLEDIREDFLRRMLDGFYPDTPNFTGWIE